MIYGFKKEKAETLSAIADERKNSVSLLGQKTGFETVLAKTPSGGIPAAQATASGKASCIVQHVSASGAVVNGTHSIEVHNTSDSAIDAGDIITCKFMNNRWIAQVSGSGDSGDKHQTFWSGNGVPAFSLADNKAGKATLTKGEWTVAGNGDATVSKQEDSSGAEITDTVYNISVDSIPEANWIIAHKEDSIWLAESPESVAQYHYARITTEAYISGSTQINFNRFEEDDYATEVETNLTGFRLGTAPFYVYVNEIVIVTKLDGQWRVMKPFQTTALQQSTDYSNLVMDTGESPAVEMTHFKQAVMDHVSDGSESDVDYIIQFDSGRYNTFNFSPNNSTAAQHSMYRKSDWGYSTDGDGNETSTYTLATITHAAATSARTGGVNILELWKPTGSTFSFTHSTESTTGTSPNYSTVISTQTVSGSYSFSFPRDDSASSLSESWVNAPDSNTIGSAESLDSIEDNVQGVYEYAVGASKEIKMQIKHTSTTTLDHNGTQGASSGSAITISHCHA